MIPGFPSVANSIENTLSTIQLDIAAFQLLFNAQHPAYALVDSGGNEVITGYTSVIGFDFQRDTSNCTHPVEQGAFASYNKVALPFNAKLRYTVNGGSTQWSLQSTISTTLGSGSDQGTQVISAFITQMESLAQNTNLYTVVTPEFSWQNVTIKHYDLARSAKSGYSMLIVDVWLEEIRQSQSAQYTNAPGTSASPTATATPDGQAQVNGGSVQPAPATNAQPASVTAP